MALIGLFSRHNSVVRAAVLHHGDLIHLDGDSLHRAPLLKQIFQAKVIHKEQHNYWLESPFGTCLLPQEKGLPPLTTGQTMAVQVTREAFYDTAENDMKAPHVTRKLNAESTLWALLLPKIDSLETLLVDDAELMSWIRPFCKKHYPGLKLTLTARNLFEEYGLDEIWDSLQFPRISFGDGYSFYIEETASAILIDVNGAGSPESINQLAPQIIAQHIIWRQLSGNILIEFINHAQGMRPQIIDQLQTLFKKSEPRTNVYGFTKLGFLEISREKRRSPLHHRKIFTP